MTVIKKGTDDWQSLSDNSLASYADRLDYAEIKEEIEKLGEEDIICIDRPHSHSWNLIQGLSRRGLIHKKDYDLRSSFKDDKEVLLLVKVEDSLN